MSDLYRPSWRARYLAGQTTAREVVESLSDAELDALMRALAEGQRPANDVAAVAA